MKKRKLLFVSAIGTLLLPLLSGCDNHNVEILPSEMELDKPIRNTYSLGEVIDLSSLNLIVTYSDKHTETVRALDNRVKVSGGETKKVGTSTLEFTFEDLHKTYNYNVEEHFVTLDFNGGKYNDHDTLKISLYNNRCDLSEYVPVKLDENGNELKFSGWFYDKELTDRATYITEDIFTSNESVTLYAQYDLNYSDRFIYTINKDAGTVDLLSLNFDNYFSYMNEEELFIPATIEGYPVVSIGSNFLYWDNDFFPMDWGTLLMATKLTFPKDSCIETIGDNAFANFTALQEVAFPKTLVSIGKGAFKASGLTGTLTFNKKLRKIGDDAFSFCSKNLQKIRFEEGSEINTIGANAFDNDTYLYDVELPEGLEEIRDEAFKNCNDIHEITLPASLRNVGVGAFELMESLERIDVNENNRFFSSLDGNLYSKDKTKLIRYCYGKGQTEFSIPSSVKSIENSAFNIYNGYTRLAKLNLNEGLEYIGEDAFNGCHFSFVLPTSLNSFSLAAFRNYLGDSIQVNSANSKYISKDGILYSKDEKTLYACPCNYNIREFALPDNVETIAENAFYNNQKIAKFIVSANSSLKEIGKNGLLLESMRGFEDLEIHLKRTFTVYPTSLYDVSNIAQNSAYVITFDDEETKEKFVSSYAQEDEKFVARITSKETIVDETVKLIEEKFPFGSYSSFLEGNSPIMFDKVNLLNLDPRLVISRLDAIYANNLADEKHLEYFHNFEKFAYASMYFFYENQGGYTQSDIRIYNFMVNRFNYLPVSIQEEVRPILNKLQTEFPMLYEEDAINALCDEVISFPLSTTNFSSKDYEKLKQKLDNAKFEQRTLPNAVYYKFVCLKASYMISQILENQDFSHLGIQKMREIMDSTSENNFYGLDALLSGWFLNENRQKDIYGYDKYVAFKGKFDQIKENDYNQYVQEINEFSLETFDEDTYWAFYRSTINPFLNFYYVTSEKNETIAKALRICACLDINTALTTFASPKEDGTYSLNVHPNSYLNAKNFFEGVQITLSNIEYFTSLESPLEGIYHLDEFNSLATAFEEEFNQYIASLEEDIDNFVISKENLASSFASLNQRFENIEDQANLLIPNSLAKMYKIIVSYIAYTFYEKHPTIEEKDYPAIQKFLNGYYDPDTFAYNDGASAYLSEYLRNISEEERNEIYRFEDFKQMIEDAEGTTLEEWLGL